MWELAAQPVSLRLPASGSVRACLRTKQKLSAVVEEDSGYPLISYKHTHGYPTHSRTTNKNRQKTHVLMLAVATVAEYSL